MRSVFVRVLIVIEKLLMWFAEPGIEKTYLTCVVVVLGAAKANDDFALRFF